MDYDGTENTKGGIQVIERAAKILRALKTTPHGMSLGQIAKSVDLPRSTVQRIVGALQTERILIADITGRGIRLGPELNALAEATRFNMVESCRSSLTELAKETGETADLSVFRGTSMIFLDQVPGTHRLRTISSVGESFPLSTTANGRSCLSRLTNSEVEKIVSLEWRERSIDGAMNEFLTKLEEVRQSGFALDLNEHTDGISAIGFAFKDWVGDLHSISVPVPSMRFDVQREHIEKAIAKTAANVRKMIKQGYE